MNSRAWVWTLLLLAAIGFSSASAVEFERKKFDRSRFERPDPTVRPPLPGTTAAPAAAPAEPVGAAPAPMVTTAPGTVAPPPAASEFAFPATPAPTNTAIFSTNSVLPPRPPPGSSPYPAGVTPEFKAVIDAPLFDEIPTKWHNNAKDHAELVALQQKTGACLLVYFKNFAVPNEKGLCNWFEKSVTTDMKWRKAMRYYLKLEISVPGNSAVQDLAAQYRAGKTPAFFVVKPGSPMGTRLKLFDYVAGSRPEPIAAELVLESLKAASTPAYQALF